MSDTKEKADGATTQPSAQQNSTTVSIPQANSASQVKKTGKRSKNRFDGDNCHMLNMDSKVNTFAFKFYDEQLPLDANYPGMTGEDILYKNIRESDPKVVQILCIKHNRDVVADGIWSSSNVKSHYHVIGRFMNDKERRRIRKILSDLHIVFRIGLDENIMLNGGIETVGKFAGYALYLTHETEAAIKDAKELYSIDEIISNCTIDEIRQIRDGYIRLSEKRKVTQEELIALDKEAFDKGYKLENFDDWYGNQPFTVRSNAKMRTIKESYERGAEKRLEEDDTITRLSIYIQGEGNSGKTYTSLHALKECGMSRILTVGGGGTGKFDKLRCDHQAIVVDDEICPNLLNMTDNKMCHAYRRNNNNPIWTGSHFIITYNESFEDYATACGINVRNSNYNAYANSYYSRTYLALESRFYICKIEYTNNKAKLVCIKPSARGNEAEQKMRLKMFVEFQQYFNALIANYQPNSINVDYSSVVERKVKI